MKPKRALFALLGFMCMTTYTTFGHTILTCALFQVALTGRHIVAFVARSTTCITLRRALDPRQCHTICAGALINHTETITQVKAFIAGNAFFSPIHFT